MRLKSMVLVMSLLMGMTVQGATIRTVNKDYVLAKNEPKSGTYAGAYVLQDEHIDKSMTKFNEVTGKKHASFFKYVGYGQPYPTEWVEECKAVGAVPHIAWEPNNGLDGVKDDEYLRQFAKDAKASDVPVFLRYASEMNGTWTEYSVKPETYIEKWKIVHDVMEQEAPNVIMVWTVFTFPEDRINLYYPGDAYVDWVGVNIYNVMYHNDSLKEKADYEDPLKLLDYVYNTYSYKKPIQISEYGVTNYSKTDEKKHIDFAVDKIERLYGNIAKRYPRVKAIFYFDVNTLVNAPIDRRINNYAITEEPKVTNAYRGVIGKGEYLSEVVSEKGDNVNEMLTYNNYTFVSKGVTYVDIEFYRNYLGLKVSVKGNKATLSDGSKEHTFSIVNRDVDKGFYHLKKKVKGLPLRTVADKFGYKLGVDEIGITVYK